MSIVVRKAQESDREIIEAIVGAAYAPYIDRIGRKPGPMLDDYAALVGAGKVHVAVGGEGVQGIVVLVADDDGFLLENIAVAPAVHGRGFGRALLEFAEKAAREAGYRSIRLYTHERMTENLALYSRIGYRETHRTREKGYQRVYMEKTLA